MIPGWKVRRELLRVVEQVRNLPRRLVEPALRWHYDRTRWSRIRISGTASAAGDKYCVLLVYQPSGLAPSLLTTCAFMASKGYLVLVVANGGLQPQDVARLQPLVWRVIERPNFGYDFGGYRDGVHFLMRKEITPRFLVLMNDSIWFPMHRASPVIERLEASAFDMTGLLLHVPSRNEYEKEQHRRPHRRKLTEHIESYLTILPERTFSSKVFNQFWQKYPQTRSKTLTIKRGEIGFSKALAGAGMKVGALSRRRMFLAEIATQSDGFLEQTLRYAAYSDAVLAAEGAAVLAAPRDSAWREKALKHITNVVARRRFNASFCLATERIFETSFVKKHPDRLFQLARARFVEAIDNGELAADNELALIELRSRVAQDRVVLGQEVSP